MKETPGDNTTTDVYVKDLQTGRSGLMATIPDSYVHYHARSYHPCDDRNRIYPPEPAARMPPHGCVGRKGGWFSPAPGGRGKT